jgi:hypothetical protein
MHPFEFAIAIVALVLVYNLIKTIFRQKHMRRSADDGVAAELAERLRQVEERVRVLERIVTDERFDLKQQFKDL